MFCDMIKFEGSARRNHCGRSLRASPQFAALANGVPAHTMDYGLKEVTRRSRLENKGEAYISGYKYG
jgi:hypothetical protein